MRLSLFWTVLTRGNSSILSGPGNVRSVATRRCSGEKVGGSAKASNMKEAEKKFQNTCMTGVEIRLDTEGGVRPS